MLVLDGYGAEHTRSNLSQNELEPKMATTRPRQPARPHPAPYALLARSLGPRKQCSWHLPPCSGAKTLTPEVSISNTLFAWNASAEEPTRPWRYCPLCHYLHVSLLALPLWCQLPNYLAVHRLKPLWLPSPRSVGPCQVRVGGRARTSLSQNGNKSR